MQLRRGEFEQYASYKVETEEVKTEETVETVEEKPKRGPGRPKKVVEDAEVDKGTTAEDK